MSSRLARRLLPLAALVCLVLPASASASAQLRRTAPPPKPAPRIVNGTQAAAGEYPAQAGLLVDVDDDGAPDGLCGGTLVGTRQVLTAAHCSVDDNNVPLPARDFFVFLGTNDQNDFTDQNARPVAQADVNASYDPDTMQNDTTMLTLADPQPFEPARIVEPGDEQLWAPDTIARIVGWGTTCSTICSDSRFLLKADVPIITDERCASSYPTDFDPATMVCAADPVGTPPTSSHDTCQGDSGGPLYVPDYGSTNQAPIFATAGVVSWGIGCANPSFPGVYARIGEGPLSTWTLGRIPRANYQLDHQPRVGEPVTFTSTSTHPEGPDYFTNFAWDFDQDGQFDDATGKVLENVVFDTAGETVVGLEASKPGEDHASVYYAFDVLPATAGGGGDGGGTTGGTGGTAGGGGTTSGSGTGQTGTPAGGGTQVARITVARRVRVRHGRFTVRVTFPAGARAGTATLTLRFKRKRIGGTRLSIKPGKTVVARVKLTRAGLRKLRKAKKLRVTLRLSGGGTTGKKTLTLRR